MLDTAARNRAIKALLEPVYGKGKVKVTGKRGTSYGWVSVAIDAAETSRDNQATVIRRLLDAGIALTRHESYGQQYGIQVRFQ
jgi:hypothetical protein